ncbi:exodeoxyribonuclease VII large subunit [Thermosulfuriphilus sp.]
MPDSSKESFLNAFPSRVEDVGALEDLGTRVFTVSQLTGLLKDLLETAFPFVWVEGEISNLRIPSSGHVYFSLKDEAAQIKVVLFRREASRLHFSLRDGLKVVCLGRLTLYEPRGEYQIVANIIEPRGTGALMVAFEELKERLRREGLFDRSRKRPLPLVPGRVGLITSPSGAAVHDFLRTSKGRFLGAWITIYPVKVQGEEAPAEICQALAFFNLECPVDVIVICRGGGSIEDLWAFNEEVVARAVAASRIPVVSAVGHEVDFTICDFVADHRAPTPTAAAQLVFPDMNELRDRLLNLEYRLKALFDRRLEAATRALELLSLRLKDPRRRLIEKRLRLEALTRDLERLVFKGLAEKKSQLARVDRHLEALSPYKVLARGYSLVEILPSGRLLTEAIQVCPGDRLRIRLKRGKVICHVLESSP